MFRIAGLCVAVLLPLALVVGLHAGDKKGDDKEFKVAGKLTDDDPKDKVLKDSPFKSYDYKMTSGVIYVIDLKSKDFDSVLRLENPAGQQVAFNDDVEPGNLDSRIVFKAPADGTYKVIATSLHKKLGGQDSTTGAFVLTVRKGTEADLPKGKGKENPFKKQMDELVGKKAEDIAGEFTLNGTTKKLSDLKGKVVLLDFWAVWCGPCIATFPHLRDWSKEYQKDGLEILGVTTYYELFSFDKDKGALQRLKDKKLGAAEEHDMVKDFAAHHKLTHQLMVVGKDNWAKANKAFNVPGYPTAILIDRQGVIRLGVVGGGPENAHLLEDEIRKLLKEK
jgi:thiol-disulfide isomerase/thioredoxin